MKTLKIIFISMLLPLIYACSHPIEIDGEGDVWSSTARRNCNLEDFQAGLDNCAKNWVAGEYQETYRAEPRTGSKFDSWGNYCIDAADNTCRFEIPAEAVQNSWGKTARPLVAVFTPDDTVFDSPPSDCAWRGPFVKEHPGHNFAFPDKGAVYWAMGYTMPEGAYVTFEADFPHSRYMSYNSYYPDNAPAQAVADRDIEPALGSVNPYIDGNHRNVVDRRYVLSVLPGEPVDPNAPLPANTLYDYAANGEKARIILRNYVPDKGTTWAGDVGLPRVTLHLNGDTLQGQDACDALQVSTAPPSPTYFPVDTYELLRDLYQPAANPPAFRVHYSAPFLVQCDFQGDCTNNPERHVQFYANLDNQYMYSFLDREFGEVAVIRARIPQVPATYEGDEVFFERELRFWSICQYEFFSQKVEECLIDEQVQINPDGFFTIVTSRDGDRPSNATEECGVGYLPWPADGDGFAMIDGKTSDPDASWIMARNMLPADDFDMAIQNATTSGDEMAVLGEFHPRAIYMSKAEFESLGCNPYLSLPYEGL
jgi:hypothetical protein